MLQERVKASKLDELKKLLHSTPKDKDFWVKKILIDSTIDDFRFKRWVKLINMAEPYYHTTNLDVADNNIDIVN